MIKKSGWPTWPPDDDGFPEDVLAFCLLTPILMTACVRDTDLVIKNIPHKVATFQSSTQIGSIPPYSLIIDVTFLIQPPIFVWWLQWNSFREEHYSVKMRKLPIVNVYNQVVDPSEIDYICSSVFELLCIFWKNSMCKIFFILYIGIRVRLHEWQYKSFWTLKNFPYCSRKMHNICSTVVIGLLEVQKVSF